LDIRDPAVKQIFKLMVPVMLGLGLINVNAVIGTVVASKLIDPRLAPTAIDKAFRIYMLPQGMFSVAVATILYPSLARLSTRGDLVGFRATVSSGLRQINFMLVPSAVVCAVLAEPIVRLLYERGAFGPGQTQVVAGALAAFSLGLTFNGMMLMLNRAFFSLQAPWVPTLVALSVLVLNTSLYAVFYRVGTWGIPLAISLANIAGVALLFVTLRRRVGRLDLHRIARSFGLVTVASAVLGVVAYGIWHLLDSVLGRSFAAQLISLGVALGLGGAAYLAVCTALRVREMAALLSLRDRFRRD
jgi:putative peptidoglycan lipid II flippase